MSESLIDGSIIGTKNLEEVAFLLPSREAGHTRFLGVDLGTHCGVSILDVVPDRPLDRTYMLGGQIDLSLGEYDTGPLRHIRLKNFLSVVKPDFIGFEEVRFTPKTEGMEGAPIGVIVARVATAAELLGGLKVTLTTWAEENGIPAQGYGIGQIKKAATGKGNANKVDMILAANVRFGVQLDPEDYSSSGHDNIADSMMVCWMAARDYRNGFKNGLTPKDRVAG